MSVIFHDPGYGALNVPALAKQGSYTRVLAYGLAVPEVK